MMGTKTPESTSSLTNALEFWYSGKLLDFNTCLPVKVLAVNSDLTVDVDLMVQGIDADNKALQPITVYNCPYVSVSAGKSGIIVTPEVNDIGIMVFCQRDITKVTNTQQVSLPDTLRKFSLSDGIYLFSLYKDPSTLKSSIEIKENNISIQSWDGDIKLYNTNRIVLESDSIKLLGRSEIDIKSTTNIAIEGSKVVTLANNQNAVSLLKEVVDTLATACALPTAPGQPVITPADLIIIQTKLALLAGFE